MDWKKRRCFACAFCNDSRMIRHLEGIYTFRTGRIHFQNREGSW